MCSSPRDRSIRQGTICDLSIKFDEFGILDFLLASPIVACGKKSILMSNEAEQSASDAMYEDVTAP